MRRLVFVRNELSLSPKQLELLAEILRDVAQITFAGLVVAQFLANTIYLGRMVIGLLISASLWYSMFSIARRLEP